MPIIDNIREYVCDQCGSRKFQQADYCEGHVFYGTPKGWVYKLVNYQQKYYFCSWKCVKDYARRMES